jgi:hypothetical protein
MLSLGKKNDAKKANLIHVTCNGKIWVKQVYVCDLRGKAMQQSTEVARKQKRINKLLDAYPAREFGGDEVQLAAGCRSQLAGSGEEGGERSRTRKKGRWDTEEAASAWSLVEEGEKVSLNRSCMQEPKRTTPPYLSFGSISDIMTI